MKFKQNVSFGVIAALFKVSEASASRFFHDTLETLYEAVKDNMVWLSKDKIQARMPKDFKALFPQTRAIIDCTEIECERPPTVPQRVQMYSSYKSKFTVKYLVATAPSGEVTFCSKGFGGRSTDTELTTQSGFLDLIEPGDLIMSDKGFPSIETDVQKAGGLLVMPPFKKGKMQLTAKELKDGYECAKVRIHVERCIERLKRFEILNFVPIHMIPHIDKVFLIVCFLHNCFPDLIRD